MPPSVIYEHSTPPSQRRPSVSTQNSQYSTYGFTGSFTNASIANAELEPPPQAKQAASKTQKLLRATKEYRKAVEILNNASAELGSALYDFSETKAAQPTVPATNPQAAVSTDASVHEQSTTNNSSVDAYSVSSDLANAGGLHLLISNHFKILANSLKTEVESPLSKLHQDYKTQLQLRESEFKRTLSAKMLDLKRKESRRLKETKNRERDLIAYRNSLQDLTSQIDDINKCKFEFLSDLYGLEAQLCEGVHLTVSKAVSYEIEVFDVIARKGWSGGGLDGLLSACPDPLVEPLPSSLAEPMDPLPEGAHAGTHTAHTGENSSVNSKLFSLIPKDLLSQPNSDKKPKQNESMLANLTLTETETEDTEDV